MSKKWVDKGEKQCLFMLCLSIKNCFDFSTFVWTNESKVKWTKGTNKEPAKDDTIKPKKGNQIRKGRGKTSTKVCIYLHYSRKYYISLHFALSKWRHKRKRIIEKGKEKTKTWIKREKAI